MGDPVQMELRGYELTLRRDEARKIEIENIHQKQEKQQKKDTYHKNIPHPGKGELGKAENYHHHDKELPKEERLHLPLRVTRTVERQPCLISLQVQISM